MGRSGSWPSIFAALFVLVALVTWLRWGEPPPVEAVGANAEGPVEAGDRSLSSELGESKREPVDSGLVDGEAWLVRVLTVEGERVNPSDLAAVLINGMPIKPVVGEGGSEPDGRYLTIPKRLGPVRLRCRLDSYGEGGLDLNQGEDLWDLILEPKTGSELIRGTVVWGVSGELESDALVLAWDRANYPTDVSAKAVSEGLWSSTLRWTRTDSHGQFELGGLPRNDSITLSVVCPGGISKHRIVLGPSSGEITVADSTLVRLLGHRVEIGLGETASVDGNLWGGPTYTDSLSDEFQPISVTDAKLELLALGVPLSSLSQDPYSAVALLRSESSLAKQATSRVTLAPPGLGTVSAEVQARTLEQDIERTLVGPGTGPIERASLPFRFTHVPKELRGVLDGTRRIGVLVATSELGQWGYPLTGRDVLAGGVIMGVPLGVYSLAFEVSDSESTGFARISGGSALNHFEASSSPEIVLELGELGGLDLHVFEEGAGEEYEGPLTLTLRIPDERVGARVKYSSFARAPYTIPLLVAGPYELDVSGAQGVRFGPQDRLSVLVEPGKLASAVVVGAPRTKSGG